MRASLFLAATLGLIGPSVLPAQVAPRPDDVATIDGIVRAFYEVVSGPAGQRRDWHRDSSLYSEGVRFVSMNVREGRIVASVMDHGTYARRVGPGIERAGFFEEEIGRVERRFGNMVHVLSAYQYRIGGADAPVAGRGVNSIQLFWDGSRWWISHAAWDDERPDNPIPPELLNGAGR